MTAELKLKPDIGAPGGLIRSTYPLEKGGYAIVSGTSMASPHVAGGAALYLEAHPGTTQAELRTRCRTVLTRSCSTRRFRDRSTGRALACSISTTRSSRPRPWSRAASRSAREGGAATLTVSNAGPSAVTYNVSHVGGLTTGGNTNAPSLFGPTSVAAFSASSITVPAGGQATLSVDHRGDPGSSPGEQPVRRVVVLTPTAWGRRCGSRTPASMATTSPSRPTPTVDQLPWVSHLTACRASSGSIARPAAVGKADEGRHVRSPDEIEETPYFLVHLEHQARELRIEGSTAQPRRTGPLFTEDYLPRSGSATSFSAFGFDGEVIKGRNGQHVNVPDGTYYVKLSALKALRDPANPAHWETWTSPTFVIDQP